VRKLRGHSNFVNAISASKGGAELIASVSDDKTCRVWDPLMKNAVCEIKERYQLTAVAWGLDGKMIYTGGIDNVIKVCLVMTLRFRRTILEMPRCLCIL
jgi:Prp8 binding protein